MVYVPEPEVTEDGRFVFSCGTCTNVVRVKNAGFRMTTDGCPHCLPAMAGTDDGFDVGFDVSDGRVNHEMGWCGCGSPSEVDRLMLAYLSSRAADPWVAPEGVEPQTEGLLAYLADGLGWTEHGGSVGGAWLTEAGHEAMRNLASVVAA